MKDNNIMVFENKQFGKVRTFNINGEPWFVAADVCKVLELKNPTVSVSKLDADERAKFKLGRQGNGTIVNESGLYSLVLGSRKPEAKAFKRWITHEVIPSIRKTGAYMTDALLEQIKAHPELFTELIEKLSVENAHANELQKALSDAREENACLLPKADYYDAFVGIDDLTCLRYTAKELGVPQNKLIGYMLEKGYVFRDSHRDGRVFAKAGERNDPLFKTRDFHLPHGRKSEYTLVTPAGKSHFKALVPEIEAFVPKKEADETVSKGERETESAVYLK